MARPEHEIAAGGGRGRLRASRADRDRVIDTLTAAYVYGLVTKDEFDARVGQTFAARTYAELTVITADIPAGLPPAPPPLRPAPAKAEPAVTANVAAADRAIIATAILAGLTLVISLVIGPATVAGLPVADPLLLGGAGSAFVCIFLFGIQMRSRRTGGPGGQPPQRSAGSGPNTGARAISAAPADPVPRAGSPQRRSRAGAARHRSLRPRLSG